MIKLTPVIERILGLMEKHNLSKTTDLAEKMDLTPAGVHRYIKRLKKAKAIRQGYAINYSAFGHIQAMLLFEFYRPVDPAVIRELGKAGFVKRMMRTEGDYDCVLFAVFRNEEELRNFLMSTLAYNDKIRGYKIAILGGEFI
ncbi:MAG TPA: Lrp/AsnC family transcriptional regulator [archaeon]|jgi:DNA-binding Lrp family transcriptional regulator|nr:Lrp/AsnC family transcriptional regulator [archaeon]